MSHWENSGTPALAQRADLMPRLYARDGRRIDFATYVRLHLDNPGFEHVASERVDDYWVSTVWFGIDCGTGAGRRQPGSRRAPAVYRTLIERLDDRAPDPRFLGLDPDTLRYVSEADAHTGHAHVVDALHEATREATAERPAVQVGQR